MLSSKKKIRKKRKKKKRVIEPTETAEVKWRLPTFPYEKRQNRVIIGGKEVTTVDILTVPGKSSTGFDFIQEQHIILRESPTILRDPIQHTPDHGLGMASYEETELIDTAKDGFKELKECKDIEHKTEEVVTIDALQGNECNDDDEIGIQAEFEEEKCCEEEKVVEESYSVENLHSRKYHSCYFTVMARVIDFHRKISMATRLGYPIVMKTSIKPKQISPEDYNNPLSKYYSAHDSFRRFLDLSSCIEATVKYQSITVLPRTCLEEMVIKEHSNEKLTLHMPPLPDLLDKVTFSAQENFSSLPSDEFCLFPAQNPMYYNSTQIFEAIKLAESDENAEIVVKFHCYSKFILTKILKFSFEVSFGVFLSHLVPYKTASNDYVPYPYPQLTILPQEMSESDILCKLVIPLKNVLLDMTLASRILVSVTCCSKPRACILRMELSRMFAKKTPDN